MEAQAPKQLSQASEDGAPIWSSGDQQTAPPTPREMAFPKDHIFQLGSSQVIKVKALRMVGRSGWGEAWPCSAPTPHHRASSCWGGPTAPLGGSDPEPGVSIKKPRLGSHLCLWWLTESVWRSPWPLAWDLGVGGGGIGGRDQGQTLGSAAQA